MQWVENLRKNMFWLIDLAKGSPIKKALHETTFSMSNSENGIWNTMALKKLINHATDTTVFYKSYGNQNDLSNFPVINKNIIRDNLTSLISDTYDLNKCSKVSTSGSTGTPFSVYQNRKKKNKNIADNIYFFSKSNFKIGEQLVYIKIWPEIFNRKYELALMAKNIYPQSVFNLSSNEIDSLISDLNKKKMNISFMGYVSAFEKVCRHLDSKQENPIKFKTSSIITISEALNDYTRKALERYFGVKPLSRYSNNENGILAQQISTDDKRLRINNSSYIIEVFDINKDVPIGYGKKGRIVITDLYNYVTPLIRYDTGDVGILEKDPDNQVYLSSLLGRKLDLLYDTQGRLIPEHLSAKLCNYGDFKQFQLVQQHKKRYQINLNTTNKVDEEKMISEYKSYFGNDAIISINYVDDIPLLDSGKRREVVNEYYK